MTGPDNITSMYLCLNATTGRNEGDQGTDRSLKGSGSHDLLPFLMSPNIMKGTNSSGACVGTEDGALEG